MFLSPEDKKRILNASYDKFPAGKFYYVKVYNRVFPIPYFFWFITPVSAIILTYLNSNLYDHSLNLNITAFSRNLDGYVDGNILLVHDVFTLGLLFTTIFVICLVPFEIFHDKKFYRDMKKIAQWYREEDLPQQDIQFIKKAYKGSLVYTLAIELVFWILYPEPSFQSFRMKMVSNMYYYLMFIGFLYVSCLFALSTIITFYGVRKDVV